MAQVVGMFELPLRKLPVTAGDVLAIADGPSVEDYDLNDIHGCGAILCGYGRSAARLHYDHYWITDFGFLEILETAAPLRVYACAPVFDERRRAPQHDWVLAAPDCTFHVAVEARRLFPDRRVFVLGVDGYFRLDGALRAAQYPAWLPPTDHTRNPASPYSHPQLYDSPTNRQQQNNCVALYLVEQFRRPVATWNLSLEFEPGISLHAGLAVAPGRFQPGVRDDRPAGACGDRRRHGELSGLRVDRMGVPAGGVDGALYLGTAPGVPAPADLCEGSSAGEVSASTARRRSDRWSGGEYRRQLSL